MAQSFRAAEDTFWKIIEVHIRRIAPQYFRACSPQWLRRACELKKKRIEERCLIVGQRFGTAIITAHIVNIDCAPHGQSDYCQTLLVISIGAPGSGMWLSVHVTNCLVRELYCYKNLRLNEYLTLCRFGSILISLHFTPMRGAVVTAIEIVVWPSTLFYSPRTVRRRGCGHPNINPC